MTDQFGMKEVRKILVIEKLEALMHPSLFVTTSLSSRGRVRRAVVGLGPEFRFLGVGRITAVKQSRL